VLVYVDDIIVLSSFASAILRLIAQLGSSFLVKDLGPLHSFLGIEVSSPSPDRLVLCQRKYALELLARAGMLKCSPVTTPMSSSKRLCSVDGDALSSEEATRYRSRILRYVHHTVDSGLQLRATPSTLLSAFSDADWASSVDDRRSTGEYAIFYGGNLIVWSARKQSTVSRSSTESEYKTLANATAELI
jgi:histone deacetylase 1/2